MAIKLRSRVTRTFLHTVLLFILFCVSSFPALSQTWLLSGDVLVVSVNASENSVELLPLVNIKEGTKFSLGHFTTDSASQAPSLHLTLKKDIEPGELILVQPGLATERFKSEGSLSLITHQNLLMIQQDGEVQRLISGIEFGAEPIKSEISDRFPLEENAWLRLSAKKYHQYHIKNGASGSVAMLRSMIQNPAYWRSSDKQAYNAMGTRFRLLQPPVVMFNRNLDYVREGEEFEVVVSVFGHNGSRLTADVVLNTAASTADTSDLSASVRRTFNFTGLIGDADFALQIPVKEDQKYEGNETLILELRNLSGGNLGDFVTEAVIIQDKDLPNLRLRRVTADAAEKQIRMELQNLENVLVDLRGWSIQAADSIYLFSDNDHILAGDRFVKYVNYPDQLNPKKPLIIKVLDHSAQVIDEITLSSAQMFANNKKEASSKASGVKSTLSDKTLTMNTADGVKKIKTEESEKEKFIPGWYPVKESGGVVSDASANNIWWWSEADQQLQQDQDWTASVTSEQVKLRYLSEPDTTNSEFISQLVDTSLTDNESDLQTPAKDIWQFTLSATDVNENGRIDGSEGFSLLHNTTGDSLNVYQFRTWMNDIVGGSYIGSHIYAPVDHGSLLNGLLQLNDASFIQPDQLIWIRLDSVLSPRNFSVNLSELKQEGWPVVENGYEEPTERDQISISMTVGDKQLSSEVFIYLMEEESETHSDHLSKLSLPLNLIRIPSMEQQLVTGLLSNGSWFESLTPELSGDSKIIIPLGFKTEAEGTVTIAAEGINEIPAGWTVMLIDHQSEKEYELYPGWSLEFEYYKTREKTVTNDNMVPQKESEAQSIIEERFTVEFIPPGYTETLAEIPEETALYQNYPNPFNPATTISIYLPESLPVKLSVFNIVGQPVAVLAEGVLSAGDHAFEWDATGLPSGMYIYQLEVGAKILTRKMTLVK